MVQRKAPDKLGIKAAEFIIKHDHNNQKRFKPSSTSHSSHHQDGKTRGPEVKRKMMKKSRSFKLSDISQQSLKSSSLSSSALRRKTISPPHVPTALLTPKKPSSRTASKGLETPPNYMKSTSCFEARKELRASLAAKSSAKTPSSSLVRTLTKAPSFKPSRPGSSLGRVDVHRATCSSTLKDSKFPGYLLLKHGGTESDGNSVVKVCPYTYCSLNGHLHKHASLPPLKRFLSAKRLALKTQKSVGPPVACEDEGVKEVGGFECFVEIYAENERKAGFGGCEVEEEEQIVVVAVECLSEGSPQSHEETEGQFSDSESISGFSSEVEDSPFDIVREHGEESACFDGLIDRQLCCNEDECEDSSDEEEEEDEEYIAVDDEGGTTVEGLVRERIEEAEEINDGRFEDQSDRVCDGSQEKDGHDRMDEDRDLSEKTEETDDLSLESRDVSEEIAGSDLSQNAVVEESNDLGIVDASDQNRKVDICDGSEDHTESGQEDICETETMDMENSAEAKKQKRSLSLVEQENPDDEQRNKWKINKRDVKDSDEDATRKFNPREPNYLPLAADPEGEKVDLRHQEADERKNSEDWMIDRALQQAVNKLGPARKRRVALLVEAFETVTPMIIEREPVHLSHRHHHYDNRASSPVFQIRPIQACN